MDALVILIVKNKEFGTLVIIACFTIAQYFQNRGQFELHLEKINTIKETSDKADKKSDEAIKAVGDIKPKVDDMHDWFKSLRDDKFKSIQGVINAEKENTI